MQLRGTRANTALALLLLLLFALVQFSSNGVVRNGGDDDGSGIGGTGRTLPNTGEGGIGGTGLKPFLTINETREIEVQWDPTLRDNAVVKAVPRPIPIADLDLQLVPPAAIVARESDRTVDSSAIEIGEAIQVSLTDNALIVAKLREGLQTSNTSDSIIGPQSETQGANPGHALPEPESAVSRVQTTDSNSETEPVSAIASWADLARALQQSQTEASATETAAATSDLANLDYDASDPARLVRPDPIQRPQLPPVQRVSPLSRTAILPPRVKPLRL